MMNDEYFLSVGEGLAPPDVLRTVEDAGPYKQTSVISRVVFTFKIWSACFDKDSRSFFKNLQNYNLKT